MVLSNFDLIFSYLVSSSNVVEEQNFQEVILKLKKNKHYTSYYSWHASQKNRNDYLVRLKKKVGRFQHLKLGDLFFRKISQFLKI